MKELWKLSKGVTVNQDLPPLVSFPACLWSFLVEGDNICNDVMSKVLRMTQDQDAIITEEGAKMIIDWIVLAR